MRINSTTLYSAASGNYYNNIFFTHKEESINPLKQESADLRVFHHHIYEYKKGIRNLILTTEKAKYKSSIEKRLNNEKIDYVIHDIGNQKINVYFGAPSCVKVVETLNPRLNELSAEQDFILGIMLGYDRAKQCDRYLKIKNNIIKLKTRTE